MKRRTFISLMGVLTASGALSLAGCSNSSASSTAASASDQPADQLDAIRQRGTLIVALEGAWQPWSYHDESDTLVGYDTEVSVPLHKSWAWSRSMSKATGTACLLAWMPAGTTWCATVLR